MNFLGLRVTRSRDDDRAALKHLTREAVIWAYRLFLDREPESNQVIEDHLRKCSSTRELRDNFIYSTEFRLNNPTLHVPVLIGDEPGMSIEDIVKSVKGNEKHKSFVGKLTDDQITAAAGAAKQLAGGK